MIYHFKLPERGTIQLPWKLLHAYYFSLERLDSEYTEQIGELVNSRSSDSEAGAGGGTIDPKPGESGQLGYGTLGFSIGVGGCLTFAVEFYCWEVYFFR